MSLNKETIPLLINALRSGEYEQGKKQLRDGEKFCCLGVACDVYRKEIGKGEWEDQKFLGERIFLPDVVQEYFGFKTTEGSFVIKQSPFIDCDREYFGFKTSKSLTALNDTGVTFPEIASLIENNLENL